MAKAGDQAKVVVIVLVLIGVLPSIAGGEWGGKHTVVLMQLSIPAADI
jgi:hypothetical protein